MGLVDVLKGLVYELVVWSGVMNLLVNYVLPFGIKTGMLKGEPPSAYNYTAVDSGGKELRLIQANGGRFYPPVNLTKAASIPTLRIRKDDVLLCGYPKTGCHWLFEIMYMLRHGKAEVSRNGKEFGGFFDAMPDIIIDSIPSPRVLNSHLRFDELPEGIRKLKIPIVLTQRNPKDTAVSYFNHHRNIAGYGYTGEFSDYFDSLFMKGQVDYGDYFDYWLDWERVLKTEKDHPILFITFEDLKSDTLNCVLRVANFLGLDITREFAQEVMAACDFQKLKAKRNEDASKQGSLFRKGKVGDWRSWLTEAQSEAVDKRWAEEMSQCSYQPKLD